MNTPIRKMSEEKPWDEIKYGDNPFTGRDQAKEEAARDLDKDPRQLLADVHAESLNPRVDFVARTLARMASMQLRVQKEVENQNTETHKLNQNIRFMTKVILVFTAIATIASCIQAYYSWKASQKLPDSISTPAQIVTPTK